MEYEKICHDVCTLTKEVGTFILSQVNKLKGDDIESKGNHDFVTYVDKTAEKLLVDALAQLLPEAGFIAEEGTSTKVGTTFNWVIDPLDGTTNFIHGIPLFAISIGLLENEKLVMGIVYEINNKECFYAWKNSKAYLNGQPIHVSTQHKLNDALLVTGFPYYDYTTLDKYMAILKHLMLHTAGIRRLGSAAVDLCYVACGRFEAFYEYGLKPWDVAGGAFIVQQAGGIVTDFSGGENFVDGRELIASNTAIHAELQTLIADQFNT